MKDPTPREKAVIEAMTMQLNNQQAVEYMRDQGFPMVEHSYQNLKTKVKKNTRQYLHAIAAVTYEQQHLDRIHELELIKKLMWEAYREEETPITQVRILAEIKDVQRYLSAYYEATEDFVTITDKTMDAYRKKYPTVDEQAQTQRQEAVEKYKQERGDF